jgi:hypothetical protein
MKRLTSLILVLTLASLQAGVSYAQRTPQRRPGDRPSGGGPGSAGSSTLERAGLKIGQQMPDVTIYDANGFKCPTIRDTLKGELRLEIKRSRRSLFLRGTSAAHRDQDGDT